MENPVFLKNTGFYFGGDYWTRTSDLLRVKKYGEFDAGIRNAEALAAQAAVIHPNIWSCLNFRDLQQFSAR